MFKIIVIGNSAVGKTSIVNRFVGNRFDHNYKATIAADFQVKILNLNGNEIRLQIWDLVGMDTNFAGMNKSFCRNASGAILVGDINDIDSIEATAKWKEQVEEIVAVNDSPIPMVLAVNKFDTVADKEARGLPLENHQTKEWVDEFASSNNFIGGHRVSAKDDLNVSSIFSMLVRQMLIKEISENQAQDE
jgi:small GTP-binding protein